MFPHSRHCQGSFCHTTIQMTFLLEVYHFNLIAFIIHLLCLPLLHLMTIQIIFLFVFKSSHSFHTCGLGRISLISLLVLYSVILHMFIHSVVSAVYNACISIYIYIRNTKKNKKRIDVGNMEFILGTPHLYCR